MSTNSTLRASARALHKTPTAISGYATYRINTQHAIFRSYFPPFRLSPLGRSQMSPQARSFHIRPSFFPKSLRHRPAPLRSIRLNSTKTPNTNVPPAELNSPPSQSLSQRLKQLSKEYGWTAVGVYFALSALDFPFCFLAVRLLGTERIGRWEHAVISTFWSLLSIPFPSLAETPAPAGVEAGDAGDVSDAMQREGAPSPTGKYWSHGVEEARAANEGETATIWTQLALAYAVHKSFIFVRVPLTAALLPKVVKTLRSWGWKVGRKPSKNALP
jgi:hypothetical protein